MAKRIVQICDLNKQEIPEGDEIVTITIKRPGKKGGRSYELSSASAARLEQQLVAGKEALLDHEWCFAAGTKLRTAVGDFVQVPKTLGDLDDEQFVADKKAELEATGRLDEVVETPSEPILTQGDCRHLKKGRIMTTLKGGKRFAYRVCTQCRNHVPEQTVAERNAYMNGKLPADVSIRDFNPS